MIYYTNYYCHIQYCHILTELFRKLCYNYTNYNFHFQYCHILTELFRKL
jgi:hypothetical protein